VTVRIALLGLGEAGSAIATDLVAAGADVRGYDPAVAVPTGVADRADEADAVRDADLVLSANSSHDASRPSSTPCRRCNPELSGRT
jgi:3-hydroxyisobutyrate dehydrogenase-like beta-hydroxyacid dehydrogenase